MSVTSLRRVLYISVLAFFTSSTVLAQQTEPSAPAGQQTSSATQDQADQKDGNKDVKKDGKQKDGKTQAAFDNTVFSEAIAENVMNDIRDGLEGHSRRLMLSAFDRDKMDGYLSFEDQLQAFFEKYEGFRVHIRIIQTSVETTRGVVLAEFEIEGTPRGGGLALRRSGQLRFELERGRKGWKVVDFRPRGFFS